MRKDYLTPKILLIEFSMQDVLSNASKTATDNNGEGWISEDFFDGN